jgi:MSHA biogenesis protein MshN
MRFGRRRRLGLFAMSVINTMLRDLEQRRHEFGQAGAYRYVRALPPVRRGRPIRLALGVGAVVVLAAGVMLGTDMWRKFAYPASIAPQSPAAAAAVGGLPGAKQIASLNESPAPLASGLALATSRELGLREAPAVEQVPSPVTEPDTPAQRRGSNAASVASATSRPNSTISSVATPIERNRPVTDDATLPPQAISLSERTPPVLGAVAAPETQIKQTSAPQRTDNEIRRGNQLLSQGSVPQAIEIFSQIVAREPLHDAARQALVAALLRSKNVTEAERVILERQVLAPKNAAFAMMLARIQAERGDNDLALETLRASLSVAGGNPAYNAAMAALLARLDQHAAAVTQYQAALRAAPSSGVWWMGLGLSLQAMGSLPAAREALGRARASDNLSPELMSFVEQRLKQLQ